MPTAPPSAHSAARGDHNGAMAITVDEEEGVELAELSLVRHSSAARSCSWSIAWDRILVHSVRDVLALSPLLSLLLLYVHAESYAVAVRYQPHLHLITLKVAGESPDMASYSAAVW